MSIRGNKMSTIFCTCRILFVSEGHILAGVSCEECPGTGDVGLERELGVRSGY